MISESVIGAKSNFSASAVTIRRSSNVPTNPSVIMPTFRCDYARDCEEQCMSMDANTFDTINRNDLRSVEILLERKVDVNQKIAGGEDNETPLNMVIQGDGDVAIICMLLYPRS